jgi:hypothetical protein
VTLAKMAVAGVLLVWFLWKARGNRLFLLGIPFLMVMGESVFFDLMRPFWTPGRFAPQTHIMGWLVAVWLFITFVGRRGGQGEPAAGEEGRRPGWFGPARILPEELPLLLIAALVGVHTAFSGASRGDFGSGLGQAADLLYLLAGYLLLRGIVARFPRRQVVQFLTAVVIANTLAAGFYIVHQGLGVSIYTGGEYFTTTFGGAEITRTFHFAPMFTLLALGFVLARSRWTWPWLVVLAITVTSVIISYTRTLLIAVAVAVVVAVVVRELKRPNATRLLRRTLVIAGSLAVVAFAFATVLPAQWDYVVGRLSEFSTAGGPSDIGNWQVREWKYTTVEDVVLKHDPLFGMGFPEPGSNPVDSEVYRFSADMAWIPILYYTGYGGLVLFAALLGGFAVRALWLALAADETRRYLGLTYLITILLTALVGFTAWTFMQPHIAPLGLWVLAFVAAETLRPGSAGAEAAGAAADDEATAAREPDVRPGASVAAAAPRVRRA